MNIWIFNHHAEPPMGQATRHFDLSKVLVQQGHQVTIIAGSFSHHSLLQVPDVRPDEWDRVEAQLQGGGWWKDGVRFIFIPISEYSGGGLARLHSWWQYFKRAADWAEAQQDHPDVIVGVTAHIVAALAAHFVAREMKVPFVYEVSDIWPRMPIESGAMSKYNPLAPWMRGRDQHLARNAKAIIGYWPRMDRHYNRLAPNVPCTFVPHPVDLERYAVGFTHKPGPRFKIIYLGSLAPFYGIGVALDAAKRLAELHYPPDVEFLIVGSGSDKERLEKRVADERIPWVSFMDAVPKESVPAILAEADALLFTMKPMALHKEFGLSGNKISDYCAAGKPILLNTKALLFPSELTGGGAAMGTTDATLASTILWLTRWSHQGKAALGLKAREIAETYYDVQKVAVQYGNILSDAIR